MSDPADPKIVTHGKVIPFPLRRRVAAVELAPLPRTAARAPKRRQRRWELVSLHLWLLVAWAVAFDHLQLAVERREVFGLLDTAAFLVAVVMPILRIRVVLEVLGRTPRLRARARRRRAERDVSLSA